MRLDSPAPGSNPLRIPAAGSKLALVALLGLAVAGCARFNRPDPVDASVERGHATRAPAVERDPSRIRIVTYNVHQTAGREIARALLDNPRLRRADIVFLQEIERHAGEPDSRAAQVAHALGFDHAYAPGYGLAGGGSHGVAILSRFPLSGVQVIELPRNDTVVNSARRVALAAQVVVDGHSLALYDVHLDARINPAARVRQLAPVLESIDHSSADRVIVGGDLNTSPFEWIGHLLPVPSHQQSRRVERLMRRHGFTTPVVGCGATSKWLNMRLDGLFTRGLDPIDYAVERTVRLSDHLPLWLDLRWADPAPRAPPAPG